MGGSLRGRAACTAGGLANSYAAGRHHTYRQVVKRVASKQP